MLFDRNHSICLFIRLWELNKKYFSCENYLATWTGSVFEVDEEEDEEEAKKTNTYYFEWNNNNNDNYQQQENEPNQHY